MQTQLPGIVSPIMVGRNGTITEAVQPQQAMVLPTTTEVARVQEGSVAPTFPNTGAELEWATEQAPVAQVQAPVVAVPTLGTSQMNVNIRLVTKAVIEMPWGFIKDELNYAFLTPVGELCVSDLPPLVVTDGTTEVWKLAENAVVLVLGTYTDVTHWRDSLTMRPDSEEELEVEEFMADLEKETRPEPVAITEAPVAVATSSSVNAGVYANMSRSQQRKHKKIMRAKGLDFLGNKLNN